MTVTRIWGVYFSPTGTTRKMVTTVGKAAAFFSAAGGKEVPFGTYDFTLPDKREPERGGRQPAPGADAGQSEETGIRGSGATEAGRSGRADMPLPVSVPEGDKFAEYALLQGKEGSSSGQEQRVGRHPLRLFFSPGDLVILGVPVYAGRLPNLLLPFLRSIAGNGAWGVPVVLFGNRDFDDALAELRDILKQGGFIPVAAAAFVGEHSFSSRIAAGRPDDADMDVARQFAGEIVHKLERIAAAPLDADFPDLVLPGAPEAERVYYRPRDAAGNNIDIRKVKPLTRHTCYACGVCAAVCPMGAIDARAPGQVNGICIKCCACVRQCPVQAKYFDDPGYLYHVKELEEKLSGRREPVLFV